jgi:hypothetical protein
MCEPTGSLFEYRDEGRTEPGSGHEPGLYLSGLGPAAFFAATVLIQMISVVLMTAIAAR